MEGNSSEVTCDVQKLHKEALKKRLLLSPQVSSLLGGQCIKEVILNNYYTPLTASLDKNARKEGESLEALLSEQFVEGTEGSKVVLCGGCGVGKTTAVEKVIWDWATNARFQHFTFVLPLCHLSFCTSETSLKSALLSTNTHLTEETIEFILQRPGKLLLVLDSVDPFQDHLSDPSHFDTEVNDSQQPTSGTVLLHSLLEGSLIPGVSFLFTCREPVLLESVQNVNLIGFSQAQRVTYFHQFFENETQAEQVLHHCKQAVGVARLSVCPAFCWTLCCLCKARLQQQEHLPETLTELCCLIVHMLLQKQGATNMETNKELLCGLAKLAERNLSFTYADLVACGLQLFLSSELLSEFLHIPEIDVTSPNASFPFKSTVFQDFVLAAFFYVHHSEQNEAHISEQHSSLRHVFLAGLSDPAQRKLLEICVGRFSSGRLSQFHQWLTGSAMEALAGYHVEKQCHIFHLLHHARSPALVRNSVDLSKWRTVSYNSLQGPDYAALAFVVKCLGEMEHLNLYCSKLTEGHVKTLIPAFQLAKSICLSQSHLSENVIVHMAKCLMYSCVRHLDLSHTSLSLKAVQSLCSSLTHSNLHTLNLWACGLTSACSEALARMLSVSRLHVLNLGANELEDEGLNKIVRMLENSTCRLQELSLEHCSLSVGCLPMLSSSLTGAFSELRILRLRFSLSEDTLHLLSQALQSRSCQLTTLILYDCSLTDSCCPSIAAALQSDDCSLTELDLSVNELYQSGALIICDALRSPKCCLEKLCIAACELTEEVFRVLGCVLASEVCRLKELNLGCNKVGDSGVKAILEALKHSNCKLQHLDLEMVDLTDISLNDICEAISASTTLSTFILKNNALTDDAVPRLVKLIQERPMMKELNLQYNDFSEDVFEMMETCPAIRY